ncbi:hypothetical protein FQN57_006095 [Myotisia sp. PD_48]|nr:hypothetical protein FQN57_006095 [Myotisia sp. PD_48]
MWYNFELAILLTGFEMKVRHDLKANIFPPRLILAGDIGRLMDYEAFCNLLSSVCATFTEVYLVLGNHEFFGVSHQEGLQLADKLQQEPRMIGRLIILNRKRVDIGDITLLGCTLWSDIPPEAAEIIQSKIKDFRRHKVASREYQFYPTDASPWSSAFATDLIGKKEKSCLNDIQCWVFGHTHFSTEFLRDQLRLFSNQRGYVLPKQDDNNPKPPEQSLPKNLKFWTRAKRDQSSFDPDKVIEV